eukprot:scaffold118852_cov33-Phaeocystis_antarctica.AAC.2
MYPAPRPDPGPGAQERRGDGHPGPLRAGLQQVQPRGSQGRLGPGERADSQGCAGGQATRAAPTPTPARPWPRLRSRRRRPAQSFTLPTPHALTTPWPRTGDGHGGAQRGGGAVRVRQGRECKGGLRYGAGCRRGGHPDADPHQVGGRLQACLRRAARWVRGAGGLGVLGRGGGKRG